MSSVAFVDESMLAAPGDATYILAAVVLEHAELEPTRDKMAELKPRRARKLHWRDMAESARTAAVHTMSGLPLKGCVVIRSQNSGESQERQRRICLERLLFELRTLDVSHVVLESRGTPDDRRDLEMLQMLRSRRIIDSTLRMDHSAGPVEPLLWAADVLCGVVAHDETAPGPAYKALASLTKVHRILP